MDFALESGSAAQASHRIVLKRVGWFLPFTQFHVQERVKVLGFIPMWVTLEETYSLAAAQEWLEDNWKVPRYFHVTRKDPA